MRIWKLEFELEIYDNLRFKDEISIEELQSFNGSRKLDKWEKKEVKRLEPEKGLPLSDSPGFYSHLPVFSENALKILNPFLKDTAEILPLSNDESDFFIINVIRVLDCIDYEASEYKLFRDGKRIMRFTKYYFKQEMIEGYHIFKIKDEPLRNVFVTDVFRETVLNSNLTGFKFRLVWEV